MQGMYSADYDIFHSYYEQFKQQKENHFPKRFIFVGRYVELKGVREIWDAFIRLQKETPNEWELWCLGKGDLDNEFPVHEKIKNFGFQQPEELKKFTCLLSPNGLRCSAMAMLKPVRSSWLKSSERRFASYDLSIYRTQGLRPQ